MPASVRPVVGFALFVAMMAGGCSLSRYDADYAESLENFREQAAFAILQVQPLDVGRSRLRLRLPEDFQQVAPRPSNDGQGEGKIDPSRLLPPFLPKPADLPGYRQTFDRLFNVDGMQVHCSLAVGTTPADRIQRGQLEERILDRATNDESFEGQQPAWEDRVIKPHAGGPAAWRVLSLRGPQIFETEVAGNPEFKRHPGVCELWLSADDQQAEHVLLVWRYPDSVAGLFPVPPAVLTETVARAVAIEPATEEGADGEPADPEPRADGSDPDPFVP